MVIHDGCFFGLAVNGVFCEAMLIPLDFVDCDLYSILWPNIDPILVSFGKM